MASPQEIISEAECFACYGASVVQMMKLGFLIRILQAFDEDADVTPNGLLAHAKCFNCLTDASLIDLFELALLHKIRQATPNPE